MNTELLEAIQLLEKEKTFIYNAAYRKKPHKQKKEAAISDRCFFFIIIYSRP